MSRSNGIGIAMIIALLLVLGTGFPANAEWRDSPFADSRQQSEGAGGGSFTVYAKCAGCRIYKPLPSGGFAGGVSIIVLNPPLPMPIGKEQLELPNPPPTESGRLP
jgi:hypothetical protein